MRARTQGARKLRARGMPAKKIRTNAQLARARFDKLGVSQEQLALRIGCTTRVVSDILSGEGTTQRVLKRAASHLTLTYDELTNLKLAPSDVTQKEIIDLFIRGRFSDPDDVIIIEGLIRQLKEKIGANELPVLLALAFGSTIMKLQMNREDIVSTIDAFAKNKLYGLSAFKLVVPRRPIYESAVQRMQNRIDPMLIVTLGNLLLFALFPFGLWMMLSYHFSYITLMFVSLAHLSCVGMWNWWSWKLIIRWFEPRPPLKVEKSSESIILFLPRAEKVF